MTDVPTCQQLNRALRADQPLSEELLSHAKACDPCAELLANDGQLASGLLQAEAAEGASDAALSRMHSVLHRESSGLTSLRSLGSGTRLALVAGVAALLIAFVALRSLRVDIDVYPRLRLYATVLTYVTLVTALLRLGLWRMDRALPPRAVEWGLFAVAFFAPLAFALQPQAHLSHPASLLGTGADLVPRAVSCFLYGAALGFVMGAVALVLTRTPKTRRPGFLILASGVLGVAALELHCALTAPLHLALGHATVAVLGGLLAVGVSSRVLARHKP